MNCVIKTLLEFTKIVYRHNSLLILLNLHAWVRIVVFQLNKVFAQGSRLPGEYPTPRGEVLVFLFMMYIIIVNSSMVVEVGTDRAAYYTATIIMVFIGTLLMTLYARYPVA